MIRISLPYIFNLAPNLETLAKLPNEDTKFLEIFGVLYTAQQTLIELYKEDSLYSPYLRVSNPAANRLFASLLEITGDPDVDKVVDRAKIFNIGRQYSEFKISFLAEIGSINSYLVTQKGPFDTFTLLEKGQNIFPKDLVEKVPEALFDSQEAGRCLSYEVPTACGYHIFRATEAVIRRYYAHITGGKAPPKVRSMGVYINAIERSGASDPKVVSALKQMKDLHRNPLIHPEAVLSTDEAVAIIGIARSVVTVMLAGLPSTLATTTTLTL